MSLQGQGSGVQAETDADPALDVDELDEEDVVSTQLLLWLDAHLSSHLCGAPL